MMMEVSLFYISNLGCLDDELALLFEVSVGGLFVTHVTHFF